MKLLPALCCVLTIACTQLSTYSYAQDKSDQLKSPSEREINIGSHVLRQKGESDMAYKNEAYAYNKIWEVPNTSKAELYNRTVQWLKNVTGATVSDVAEDENDKNSLGVTLGLELPDHNIQNQVITFRFVFSFKDNKVRLEADGFNYYGSWDRGYQTRQVAAPYGMRTERYLDAGEYKKEFHNLRPLLKGQMRTIYEDFDERYLKIIRSMKAKVISKEGDNW